MKMRRAKGFVVRLMSVSLICVGFMQFSSAGVISSEYLADAEARVHSIDRIEALLASERVAGQLATLGVSPDVVRDRIQGLSDAELVMLQNQMDEQIAGGSALGVIGAVFLVLMILELVGVTDIFKSF